MKLVSGYICLEDLRFHAYHGVLPQERLTGNDYLVNVRLKYDFSRALCSDHVRDTLNYAQVYQLVAEMMAEPVSLLERVCGKIADRLMNAFPAIETLDLRITKVNPPMGADCKGATVEAHFENLK